MDKIYKQHKENIDNLVYNYLICRLCEPIENTDAYLDGCVDSNGNSKKNEHKWSYTKFDKFVNELKKLLPIDKMKTRSDIINISNIDPLRIIIDKKLNSDAFIKNIEPIISYIEQYNYFPNINGYDDNNGFDVLSFRDKVSFMLTLSTFLLYSIKYDRLPTDIEFNNNILPSVEITFNVRSIGTNDEYKSFCYMNKLSDKKTLTNDGILFTVNIAKLIQKNNLTTEYVKNIDNQYLNWIKIAETEI